MVELDHAGGHQWLQKATFLELWAKLASALQHKKTRMRISLCMEKQVAIPLWKSVTQISISSGEPVSVAQLRWRSTRLFSSFWVPFG